MKFFFKAKNELGEVKEGFVEAIGEEFATEILQKNGLILLSLKVEENKISLERQFQRLWEGVNQRELAIFFRQLATLIEAKVPVTSSLQSVAEQTDNEYLRSIAREMSDDIDDGMPFSEALERHKDTFSSLIINMVKAGEISGGLQRSIKYIADNIEKNYYMTSKIKGSLMYPGFVIGAASIIGFLVITFILPKITAIIKEMGIAVPWYTKVLMWLGDFMQAYWWAVLLVTIGAIVGFMYYADSEAGKRDMEEIILKIPVVGTISSRLYLIRFAENLSALLAGGIPIVRALTVVADVVGNGIYKRVILQAADNVRTGGLMSQVLMNSPVIPPMVAQMVKIGEETGSTVQVLKAVSDFYSQEVDMLTKNMMSLIEPILIVVLGIGVAIMVVGILLPIYNIAGQL
ncbi:MAG: type II secretion system F family protein [Candidatus Moranbacteria bacterium]|nr:type II secretion system F family protein [Candidatus Moranbacteria bacterium]